MSNGSILWQFFTKEDQFFATCNMCHKKISHKTTTANLKKHMMRIHPTEQFLNSMKLVQSRTQARLAEKRRKDFLNSCDPYENVILYEGKPQISVQSIVSQETMDSVEENENSKHEPLDNEDISDIEYPFDEDQCDTIQPRPWTPVQHNDPKSTKEKTENLGEICQKLVKTLEAREAREERLLTQQQNVIAKLDQTLLLMTQVLVKLNDKFDKL